MPLDNYYDLSVAGSDVSAGFQFEFFCTHCDRRWKSAFKPYRMGQITGLLNRFSFLFSDALRTAGRTTGNFSDMGSRGARGDALAEASKKAEAMYTVCEHCHKAVCADCYDTARGRCLGCLEGEQAQSATAAQQNQGLGATACPNCQQAHAGGRFCAECGFDMASTHKSCPGCGTMLSRQARFCTDCGHGF